MVSFRAYLAQILTLRRLIEGIREKQLPEIADSVRVRRLEFIAHYWRRKDELISSVLVWESKHGTRKREDLLRST